ncbi:MAG: phosphatase PAP2 family protein [Enterococcus sp.]
MKNKSFYWSGSFLFLIIFLLLATAVLNSWTILTNFDTAITQVIRSLYPYFTSFFIGITQLGNPVVVGCIYLICAFALYRKNFKISALWLSVNVIGIAALLNSGIKLLVARQRPALEHLVTETSYSFPSGHSTGSMMLYGTLFCLVPLLINSKNWRLFIRILLIGVILAVGISRIYLGVHFPSDVVGGYALGITWLLFTYPLYKERFMHETQQRKKEQ